MNDGEVTAEELRELIREGHGMIRDLTRIMKQTRALMHEADLKIEEAKDADYTQVENVIGDLLAEAGGRIAKDVAQTANDACALVQDTIYKRFDLLMDVLMGYDRGRRSTSIGDLVINRVSEPDMEALKNIASPLVRPET